MVCYVKQAGHKNTNTVQLHLNEVPRIIKFIDSAGRMVIARGWEEERIRVVV